MSIRISSRSRATPQAKPAPVKPSYDSEEEKSDDVDDEKPRDAASHDAVDAERSDEEQEQRKGLMRAGRKGQQARDSDEEHDRGDEDDDHKSKEDEDRNKNAYQNGIENGTEKEEHEPAQELTPSKKEPPPVTSKPVGSVVPAILSKAPKNWPPPAPKKYDAFAVEGHGRMNPYTKELIPEKLPEEEQPEEDKRLEIDEGHTRPVGELKKNWQGGKSAPCLGVQRPAATVQGNDSWIKHVKPPVEYEEPPKEPDWLKLVRNRRWNSTVKARFPCRTADVVDFERRSTTPKNWKRLLLDKKAVRTIGEITGIGAEGEELLWRLAKQRGKVDEGAEVASNLPIPGQQDLLAYEHIKENLEAAVVEAAIQAGIDPNEYPEDGESVVSGDSGENRGRKVSESSTITTSALRQRLLRLHPEEFKKLLALDRARDAHLRWQFSTDPYDSVHEHQLQPFEMALLSGERENRLRYLLKKLLKAENMPTSRGSSGRSTPVYNKPRARSLSASCNVSDQESDSGSSVSSARRSRSKKKAPVPLPRKGRSVSPSHNRNNKDEEVHGFLGPEDEQITSELRKLEQMTEGMGLPPEISDLLNKRPGSSDRANRERPQDSITMGLDDRKRGFLTGKDAEGPVKSSTEKEQPSETITRSLVDRKMSFLDEAQKALTRPARKTEESDLEEQDGGRVSDIDTDEISSRRRRFLDQEKQAKYDRNVPEKEKKRHKVQRIKSDAELYAVMSKRRMATDEDETASEDPSSEMKGILEDITKTFGGQQYTRIGKRKPRFQSSDKGDSTHASEEGLEEEDDEEDDDDDAPTRRSRRQRETKTNAGNNRRQRRARTKDWSESEDSQDDDYEKDER